MQKKFDGFESCGVEPQAKFFQNSKVKLLLVSAVLYT
nr:MAG TPA: hypothetical protein [Caudoviricetes sp.]